MYVQNFSKLKNNVEMYHICIIYDYFSNDEYELIGLF